MATDPYERLSRYLNFTPEDLNANREGYITERQYALIRQAEASENKDLSFGLIFIITPSLALCAACFLLVDLPAIIGSVDYLWEVIFGFIALIAVVVGISAWQGRHAGKALEQGLCDAVDGVFYLVADETRARPRFYIAIDNRRFRIPWRVHEAMLSYQEAQGQLHRLYYVPGSQWVLSMEPLDELI